MPDWPSHYPHALFTFLTRLHKSLEQAKQSPLLFLAKADTKQKAESEFIMWFLIMGVIGVIGGLSGNMVLRGTDSSGGLAIVGGIFIIIGIAQLVSAGNAERQPSRSASRAGRRGRAAPAGSAGGHRGSRRSRR